MTSSGESIDTPVEHESQPPAHHAPAPAPIVVDVAADPGRRRDRVVTTLAIVAAVEAVVILGLVVALVWVGYNSMFGFGMMPSPEEEAVYMLSDDAAAEVGYLLGEGDTEEYLELYDPGDTSVDMDEVRSDFEAAAEDAADNVEYMAEQARPYEDAESGALVVETDVRAMNWETGSPVGRRLRVYVEETEDGWRLTGRKGRDLTPIEGFFF